MIYILFKIRFDLGKNGCYRPSGLGSTIQLANYMQVHSHLHARLSTLASTYQLDITIKPLCGGGETVIIDVMR